jgi:calcium permeable stress-gated cation channel
LIVSARLVDTISISSGQRIVIKAMFYVVTFVAVIGLATAGALLYAFGALSQGTRMSETVADGYVYITVLVLAVIIVVLATSPALLVLQPLRLRRVLRAERVAKTPRQRFRGMIAFVFPFIDDVSLLILVLATYPGTYNPLFAMAFCILAVTFASVFTVIFPLIGPPVVLLVFLTLVGMAHTSRFRPESDQRFSPPLSRRLRVRPHPLANWRLAADLAAEALCLAPRIATRPSRLDSA